MAYVSQERKTSLAPNIKAVLKKFGMKGTIAVRNKSTLVVTVSQGPLDVIGNMYEIAVKMPDSHYARNPGKPTYIDVNTYWIDSNYSGKVKEFLLELKDAMQGEEWFDKSDIQTDYFHISWYIDINIGSWNKPYQLTK
jgi:hypothetical protein